MITYPERLRECGVVLAPGQQFTKTKDYHTVVCMTCNHIFSTTPLSITQIFKKWGTNGCSRCNEVRRNERETISRQANIQTLVNRGFEILSDWDGRNCIGATNTSVPVTVKQTKCGHTFTSNAVNLLRRGITCSTCGKQERTNYINQWSELNSARWNQTASEWKKYRSQVTKLTRATYKLHKDTINPQNLPFGRAGTEGAYHLDHIVSVRYGFDNNIAPEQLSQSSNLQVIPWLENVVKRDKLV